MGSNNHIHTQAPTSWGAGSNATLTQSEGEGHRSGAAKRAELGAPSRKGIPEGKRRQELTQGFLA